MTTTERRLAITPGTWQKRGRYDVYASVGTYIGTTRANNPEEMPENFRAIDEANAELIADAGTTANACDMLPSELLAKLMEAEIALLRIGQEGHCAPSDGGWDAATEYKTRRDIARKCLSTLNLPK